MGGLLLTHHLCWALPPAGCDRLPVPYAYTCWADENPGVGGVETVPGGGGGRGRWKAQGGGWGGGSGTGQWHGHCRAAGAEKERWRWGTKLPLPGAAQLHRGQHGGGEQSPNPRGAPSAALGVSGRGAGLRDGRSLPWPRAPRRGGSAPRTFVPDQVVSQNDEEAEQEEDDDGHHSADDRVVRAGGRRHRAGVCPGGREGESRERKKGDAAVPAVRQRLRLAPRIARGCRRAGPHPARPRCCGGKEGAGAEPGGEAARGKQRPRVSGSPAGVSAAVGKPRPACAPVLRDCSAVTVP